MSDQEQPGQNPWQPGGTPPPPPPPAGSYPSYPSYPSGQPASPYASQPGYPAQPAYGAPYGYAGPAIPYAHWGLRVAAYLLDLILLIPGYFVSGIGAALSESVDNSTQSLGILLMVVGYAGAIGFAIWNQIIRQGRTGSSLGKQWVGIRVIREDSGQPLGGWLTFGRSLLHILDGLPCYLGYLWPLWDAKRQTFADKLVHSVVLHQPQVAQAQPQPY